MNKFIYLFCIIYFYISCNSNSKKIEKSSLYYKGNLKFALGEKKYSPKYFKFCSKTQQFYLYSFKQNLISIFNNSAYLIDSIKVGIDVKIDDYYVLSADSIYLNTEETNTIYLINNKGATLAQYTLPSNDSIKIHTYNYLFFPLVINNNLAYTYHYYDGETDKNNLKHYFSKPREIVQQLNNPPEIIATMGRFPATFKSANYNEMNPMRTFGYNSTIVYSFTASDSVFQYSSLGHELIARKISTTMFKKPKELNEDKITRDRYFYEITKYAVENDFFGAMLYNEKFHKYYKILKKGVPISKSDGTKIDYDDCPWYLIVMNPEFVVETIIEFPLSTYFSNAMLIANEKLLIPKLKNKNEISFDVFTIH